MSRPIVAAVVVAATVVLIAALFYVFYPSTTAPPSGRPITDADRADRARETIAELREPTQERPVDYEQAFAEAEVHRNAGRLADAHLLYRFAARNGHGRSAFQLGVMYDPLSHDPTASFLPQPDAFQAYRWYAQAREAGVTEAEGRLGALREWAEEEARRGNAQAEQLMLQWN
jgi:TPR repeat protein